MAGVTITGGDKWRALLRRVAKAASGMSVEVGIMPGSTNEEGKSVAEYAAYNEFGTANIPARPFMRTTVSEQGTTWARGFAGVLKHRLAQGPEEAVRMAFQAVGRVAQADIMDKIKSNMPPPNKAAAIRRKKRKHGETTTLIDTNSMLKAIDFNVLKDGSPLNAG